MSSNDGKNKKIDKPKKSIRKSDEKGKNSTKNSDSPQTKGIKRKADDSCTNSGGERKRRKVSFSCGMEASNPSLSDSSSSTSEAGKSPVSSPGSPYLSSPRTPDKRSPLNSSTFLSSPLSGMYPHYHSTGLSSQGRPQNLFSSPTPTLSMVRTNFVTTNLYIRV